MGIAMHAKCQNLREYPKISKMLLELKIGRKDIHLEYQGQLMNVFSVVQWGFGLSFNSKA
jgi:hypothetical protein